jgi:hypothetical protein
MLINEMATANHIPRMEVPPAKACAALIRRSEARDYIVEDRMVQEMEAVR